MIRGRKAVDLSGLAASLKDPSERHVELGLVYKPGNDPHFTIDEFDGKAIDVWLEVQLVPTGDEFTCRLCCIGNSNGTGIYKIPPVGAEVIVVFPGGNIDNVPYVVATGSSVAQDGDYAGMGVPEELDEDTFVISNDKAIIMVNGTDNITIHAKAGKVLITGDTSVEIKDKSSSGDSAVMTNGTLVIKTGNVETINSSSSQLKLGLAPTLDPLIKTLAMDSMGVPVSQAAPTFTKIS